MADQDEFEATISFKIGMMLFAEQNWPRIASRLTEMLKLDPPLKGGNDGSFNFFIALLFIQSRALYNIYGSEQGSRIWIYLNNIFTAEQKGLLTINHLLERYEKIWNSYLSDGFNPIDGIVSAFLYTINYPENDDKLLVTAISSCIAAAPPWWKNFNDSNYLTRSDIPLGRDQFLEFAESVLEG